MTVALGKRIPGPFHRIGAVTVAHVNLPVAALVWRMVIPMLLKIDLAALGQVKASGACKSAWRRDPSKFRCIKSLSR
jgi:ACR3 family arsenite efflux pump ArsB